MRAACLIVLLCCLPLFAGTVVTFDPTWGPAGSPWYTSVPPGWGGFDWSGWVAINGPVYYTNIATSGIGYYNVFLATGQAEMVFVGGNAGTTTLGTFSRGVPFVFESAILAAAWRNDVTATINGYLGGKLVATTNLTVNDGDTPGALPTTGTFGWYVDTITMQGYGGTGGYDVLYGQGDVYVRSHIIISSFTYSDIPEPATLGLAALALGVAGCTRRRSGVS